MSDETIDPLAYRLAIEDLVKACDAAGRGDIRDTTFILEEAWRESPDGSPIETLLHGLVRLVRGGAPPHEVRVLTQAARLWLLDQEAHAGR